VGDKDQWRYNNIPIRQGRNICIQHFVAHNHGPSYSLSLSLSLPIPGVKGCFKITKLCIILKNQWSHLVISPYNLAISSFTLCSMQEPQRSLYPPQNICACYTTAFRAESMEKRLNEDLPCLMTSFKILYTIVRLVSCRKFSLDHTFP